MFTALAFLSTLFMGIGQITERFKADKEWRAEQERLHQQRWDEHYRFWHELPRGL